MAEARTLVALSRVFGDVPDTCRLSDQTTQVCLWRANSNTPGHLIPAGVIGTRQRVRVVCAFPVDGSPRTTACEIEKGS